MSTNTQRAERTELIAAVGSVCHYGSNMERDIHLSLTRAGIIAIHESQGGTSGLDFFLPDYDVYIEVKAFHANRIARQMAAKPNVIAVQGLSAVNFLIFLLNSKIGGCEPSSND